MLLSPIKIITAGDDNVRAGVGVGIGIGVRNRE